MYTGNATYSDYVFRQMCCLSCIIYIYSRGWLLLALLYYTVFYRYIVSEILCV